MAEPRAAAPTTVRPLSYKMYLFLAIVALMAALVLHSNYLISRLNTETQTLCAVLARFFAITTFKAAEDPTLRPIFREVVANINFPIILTDTGGIPRAWKLIDVPPSAVPDSVLQKASETGVVPPLVKQIQEEAAKLDRRHPPIKVERLGTPGVLGYVHYGEPPVQLNLPSRPDHEPKPSEWKTPPLWGVADSAPYLHDGRAATLEEAIRLHRGQGARSAERFAQLTPDEQAQLIASGAFEAGGPGPPARSLAVSRARTSRRILLDRWASRLVVVGGIVIIACILAILFVIAAEVYPLFKAPTAAYVGSYGTAGAEREPATGDAVGVDEYREVAYVLTTGGRVDFFALKGGESAPAVPVPGLDGATVTSVAVLGKTGFLLGTSDGRSIPLDMKFDVSFKDGKRTVTRHRAELHRPRS